MDDTTGLNQLGNKNTEYRYENPHLGILETFPNQYPQGNYLIKHHTQEFTSLCPKTGQPDFARMSISYIADNVCVETKSLKLYLFAYRNEGSFMETICNRVLQDLVEVCQPRWMKVCFTFSPRGGIQTKVAAEHRK